MKRIQHRAVAVLLPALLILLGLGVLLMRLALHGEMWATYSANTHIYRNGVLTGGTLTDRNGVLLSQAENGEYTYAEEEAVRFASLHAVGDHRGQIGSGALSLFAGELAGYSPIHGTTGQGETVALSLDSRLQAGAWYALNGRRGAVILMNYKTGEILCMVSSPSYDPLYGPRGNAEGVYINRCIGGVYVPGSVYKIVTLIAARENLPDLDSRTFVCDGSMDIAGEQITCPAAHGTQTVEQAFANSCNAAFGQLAVDLGGQTLLDTARRLGVEGSLPFYDSETASGNFSVAARDSAPLAWSGIGQYDDLVTPYAMARLCAAIANGGTARDGVLAAGDVGAANVLMDANTAEFAGECLNYNVVYSYGRNNFPGLDLCAKTGTAELGDGSTHAWFVGYLQSGAPIAFAVLLERGGGGLIQAGSVANHVLQLAAGYYS